MKKIIYLLGIIILSYSCSSSDNNDLDVPEAKDFSVEIITNDDSPVLWQQVGFHVKHNAQNIKAVLWDFGDGTFGKGITVEHSYKANGTYQVAIIATNNDGVAAKHTISLNVEGRSLSKSLKNFDTDRVWICAHRCNTGDMKIPENSIPALKKCIELGYVDIAEIDPCLTKDGVIVIMHDKSVDRTTNGSGNVSDLTYAQIHALRLKLPDGTITKDTVPTLEGFLKVAKGKIYTNLDYVDRMPHKELYHLVKDCKMLDEVMFYTSNDNPAINSLLGYSPQGIAFTYTGKESDAAAYKEQGVYITQISTEKLLSTNLGLVATQNSLAVFSNTLTQKNVTIDYDLKNNNDYSGVDKLLSKGINIIQTDEAPLMNTYLKSKSKR